MNLILQNLCVPFPRFNSGSPHHTVVEYSNGASREEESTRYVQTKFPDRRLCALELPTHKVQPSTAAPLSRRRVLD